MNDLNDLIYFAAVVSHQGFAPAARALKEPKSKLSRRVARLEERLGVRLLERTSRRFRVTEVGQELYRHCETIRAEVEAAGDVIAKAHGAPKGLVRVSCPTGFTGTVLSQILPDFLAAHPEVRVQAIATNRRIDLIEERVDLALRARARIEGDASLVMRTLGHSRALLVASPSYLRAHGAPAEPSELARHRTLAMSEEPGPILWTLEREDGATSSVEHEARLATGDFHLLERAACEGLGIAFLPDHVCHHALADGRLVRVLPDWSSGEAIIHMVFTARRGLLPAVRAVIDHVAETFPRAMQRCHEAPAATPMAV